MTFVLILGFKHIKSFKFSFLQKVGVLVTLESKAKLVLHLDHGLSVTMLMEYYGICIHYVCDIKKQKPRIMKG